MLMGATAGLLAALALVQQTDTTFTVDPKHRLDLSNYAGEISVRTWTRDAVRIVADHSRRDGISVERSNADIRIRSDWWQPYADEFQLDIDQNRVGIRMRNPQRPSIVNYELTVPVSMPLVVGGPRTDVVIEGTEGEVTVAVNEGDITVLGGRGRISLRSIEGDIRLENANGRLRLFAIEGDINVFRTAGEVVVQGMDGDIILDEMRTSAVEAVSVDGEIRYSGVVEPGGLYVFGTHDGDVTVEIPEDASARVTVATFDGDFSTDFDVPLPRRQEGRRFSFTLGSGAAQMEIEAFDGDIQLLRVFRPRNRGN